MEPAAPFGAVWILLEYSYATENNRIKSHEKNENHTKLIQTCLGWLHCDRFPRTRRVC